MNKVLFSVLIFLFGISSSQAQETGKTTNITREDWKKTEDIDILNDKYDISQVSMDEVFVIRDIKEEKPNSEKDLKINNSNSRTSAKAGSTKVATKKVSSSSTEVRSKKKKSKKRFKKRLKNRKFKKYTGKSCFKF